MGARRALEALEKDEHSTACQRIEEARRADIVTFAETLHEFGLVDLAYMGGQARNRMQFLDEIDRLARDENTLESTMHKVLSTNLWVFGSDYTLVASNKTLENTILDYTNEKLGGPRARKRPDLFLAQGVGNRYHLIEFKRPSHALVRDDQNQAEKYRDDLSKQFRPIDILIIGGKRSSGFPAEFDRPNVKVMTYESVISAARTQLEWLMKQLTTSDFRS
jgi:hypothetical protein